MIIAAAILCVVLRSMGDSVESAWFAVPIALGVAGIWLKVSWFVEAYRERKMMVRQFDSKMKENRSFQLALAMRRRDHETPEQ